MNMPASRLIVRQGKSPQSEYALSEKTVVIGREPINDIMFQELEISRRHASISFTGGLYTVEDLASTNGTFVNGHRISAPVALNDGDVLDLGDTVSLIFQGGPPAAEVTRIDTAAGMAAAPTVQNEPVAPEPPYAPPTEVPQYPQQSTPTPPPTWQTSPPAYPPPTPSQIGAVPPPAEKKSRRTLYIGCGCLILLIAVGCIASVAFLDTYQNGDLLYCQTLRPIWEVVFGVSRVAAGC